MCVDMCSAKKSKILHVFRLQVGVELNRVVQHDHMSPLLAFVGGLGLRKADAIKAKMQGALKTIASRNELLERKVLGLNVWTNAVGFLRVRDRLMPSDMSDDESIKVRMHSACAPFVLFHSIDRASVFAASLSH